MRNLVSNLRYPLMWLTLTLWYRLDATLWQHSVVLMRETIRSGDTGQLVLSAVIIILLQSVPTSLLFIALQYALNKLKGASDGQRELKSPYPERINAAIHVVGALMIYWLFVDKVSLSGILLSTIASLVLLSVAKLQRIEHHLLPTGLVVIQGFLAMHWLVFLLPLEQLGLPLSEVQESLRHAAAYLEGERTLSLIGFAFFAPFFIGALTTTLFFRLQSINTLIIKENYDKARTLEAMRSSMMANRLYQEIHTLAHDLKTPLVTIRGLNSLMQLSVTEEKRTLYTSRIEGAIEKMSDMISSFLYADSKRRISPEALLRYIQAQLPIEDEGLTIDIYIAPGLPEILINQVRVARGIINLVENALLAPLSPQATNKQIAIRIEMDPETDDHLSLTIRDNGAGIPESQQQKIWEIGHSSRKTTGLGLPFAKQVIEENSGTIAIESTFGVGTQVTIKFPIPISAL